MARARILWHSANVWLPNVVFTKLLSEIFQVERYCESNHEITVDNIRKLRVDLQVMTFSFFLEISRITGDITPLSEIDVRKSSEHEIMPLAFK